MGWKYIEPPKVLYPFTKKKDSVYAFRVIAIFMSTLNEVFIEYFRKGKVRISLHSNCTGKISKVPTLY